MKSKIAATLAAAAILMSVGTAANAGISQRQDRQETRIQRGIDNGQLTRRETRKLRAEQRDIQELKRCLKRVGGRGLQPMERRVLVRLLNAASDNIRELKHNDQRRRGGRRGHRSSHNDYDNNTYRDQSQRRGKYSWLRSLKF